MDTDTRSPRQRIIQEGRNAYSQGAPARNCPYRQSDYRFEWWQHGWHGVWYILRGNGHTDAQYPARPTSPFYNRPTI